MQARWGVSDTAYVVMAGAYSDRHVVAVFSDEEALKRFLAICNMDSSGDEYYVHEFALNEPDLLRKDAHRYRVTIWYGEVHQARLIDDDTTWLWPSPGVHDPDDLGETSVCVMARDIDHAKKIAADEWMQYEAHREGLA